MELTPAVLNNLREAFYNIIASQCDIPTDERNIKMTQHMEVAANMKSNIVVVQSQTFTMNKTINAAINGLKELDQILSIVEAEKLELLEAPVEQKTIEVEAIPPKSVNDKYVDEDSIDEKIKSICKHFYNKKMSWSDFREILVRHYTEYALQKNNNIFSKTANRLNTTSPVLKRAVTK
jgi:hypothetical protein